MKWIVLFVMILLFPLSIFGESNTIDSIDENINLNNSLQYLRSIKKLRYSEAIRKLENNEFKSNEHYAPLNFGYDSSDFWFYTELNNIPESKKILFLPYPYHQNLELFIHQNGVWKSIVTGSLKEFKTRGEFEPVNFAWPIQFEANDTVKILINIKSRATVIMSLELQSTEYYITSSNTRNLLYGVFYGSLFVMVLYNLLLFIIIRDKAYLFYIILVMANIAVFGSVTGYAFKYLHPSNPEINYYIKEFLIGFLIIPTSLFAISFLNLKKYSKPSYWVLYFMILIGIVICFSSLAGYSFGFSSLVISIHAPILFVIGLIVRWKGNRIANFYIIAWFGYLIGGAAMALRNRGLLPAMFFTDHGAEIGAVLDVFLLAIALAYKYKKIRNEKSELQRENISLIERQNEILEERVKKRTELLNSTLNIVQQQHDELRIRNLEINSSIKYAVKIQESMFPDRDQLKAAFKDVMLFYHPKETVSGDFFFFEKINDKIFVAVVDCTGHGVPGALMSMAGYNLFYDAINVEKLDEPKLVIEYVERHLHLRLNQRENTLYDGMEVAMCIIDQKQNKIQFCGAQRPLLILEAGQDYQLIKGTKRSIGGHLQNLDEEFKEFTFSFNGHTTLYLFSDGFQDQFGGEKDKKYMSKKLIETLTSIANHKGGSQEQMLEKEFNSWKGKNEQVDDVLILGLKL